MRNLRFISHVVQNLTIKPQDCHLTMFTFSHLLHEMNYSAYSSSALVRSHCSSQYTEFACVSAHHPSCLQQSRGLSCHVSCWNMHWVFEYFSILITKGFIKNLDINSRGQQGGLWTYWRYIFVRIVNFLDITLAAAKDIVQAAIR